MSAPIIRAVEYCGDEVGVVDSAGRVAAAILAAAETEPVVTVSMAGLSGIPSSFFNVILGDVAAVMGVEQLASRLVVTGLSAFQSRIFERSLSALSRTG